MAFTIEIIPQGKGTAVLSQQTINHTYTTGQGYAVYTDSGTAYTVTATPALGWAFDSVATKSRKETWTSYDGGATWTHYPVDDEEEVYIRTNPASSNVTPDTPALGWLWLFDGYHLADYSANPEQSQFRQKFVYIVESVKVTFVKKHWADGPILRSDAGVILRADDGTIIRQG